MCLLCIYVYIYISLFCDMSPGCVCVPGVSFHVPPGVSFHVSPGRVCVPGVSLHVSLGCICVPGISFHVSPVCLCPLCVFMSLGFHFMYPGDTHPVSPQQCSSYQCSTEPLEHRALSNRSRALLILQSQQEALKDAQDCCTLKPLWPKVSEGNVHANLSTNGT